MSIWNLALNPIRIHSMARSRRKDLMDPITGPNTSPEPYAAWSMVPAALAVLDLCLLALVGRDHSHLTALALFSP